MKKRPSRKSSTTETTILALRHEEALQRLRDANARLARQLSEARAKSGELVSAVYRAASDAASALHLPSVTPQSTVLHPSRSRQSKLPQTDEVALITIGDLQLAKVTASYNSTVAAQRMALYAEKVANLTTIQRSDHPIRTARIYLLGDIVEGELIFPSQPYLIDASLYKQVMIDGPQILVSFIRSMLATFERVHVVGVVGNHGQLGGSSRGLHNPTTNADRMLYRFVAELLKEEPRVSFHIPDRERERDWYAVDYPVGRDYGILLFHGDQIRGGFGGFPFYGLAKRVWGWRSGAVKEDFRYAIYGHWHTPTRVTLNSITTWCNGSPESDNTYAQENLAACGRPTQLLMFAHPKHGITAEYWVNLE